MKQSPSLLVPVGEGKKKKKKKKFEWNFALQHSGEYGLLESLGLWLLIWNMLVAVLEFLHNYMAKQQTGPLQDVWMYRYLCLPVRVWPIQTCYWHSLNAVVLPSYSNRDCRRSDKVALTVGQAFVSSVATDHNAFFFFSPWCCRSWFSKALEYAAVPGQWRKEKHITPKNCDLLLCRHRCQLRGHPSVLFAHQIYAVHAVCFSYIRRWPFWASCSRCLAGGLKQSSRYCLDASGFLFPFLSFRVCFLKDPPSLGLGGRTPACVGLACSAPCLARLGSGLQVFSFLGCFFHFRIWVRV